MNDLENVSDRLLVLMARDALSRSERLSVDGKRESAWRSAFLASAIAMEIARREGARTAELPGRAASILDRERGGSR
ncbi:MAG: hypothetical protein RLO50_13805 [Azospirillaceae bacterium]